MVCPITTEADSYGATVMEALKEAGLRAGIDLRNEKINYKVREHSVSKIPVILAVGGVKRKGGLFHAQIGYKRVSDFVA